MKRLRYYSAFTRRLISSLGCNQRKCKILLWRSTKQAQETFFFIYSRFLLSQIVWNSPKPTRFIWSWHIGHHRRDWAENEVRTSWLCLGIIKKLSESVSYRFSWMYIFRLSIWMLPFWSRFWFTKDIHPNIILCTQLSRWGSGIWSTSLSTVQSHSKNMNGASPYLGSVFLLPDRVGSKLYSQFCQHFG